MQLLPEPLYTLATDAIHMLCVKVNTVGSEIRPFKIRKDLKSGLFEGQIWALDMAIAIVLTIQNQNVFL